MEYRRDLITMDREDVNRVVVVRLLCVSVVKPTLHMRELVVTDGFGRIHQQQRMQVYYVSSCVESAFICLF